MTGSVIWSIWSNSGQFDLRMVSSGAASGCNRHREQNNRCTLINRVKLYSVRVRDITFWHQSSLALLDIHSSLLEYYFRILNTERISPLPPPLFPTRRIKRLGYRGAWVRIWIPRRPPQLFPRTLLIAVEKLYNRREKRSKYKFSETGKLVFVRCVGLSVLHIFWSSFIVSDGRSVVDSVDCCLLFKLSTQLEIEVLQLLHSIRFALSLIYPVATWLLHAGCAIYLDIGCCIFSDAVVDINMIDL